jgi:hypothetical protein
MKVKYLAGLVGSTTRLAEERLLATRTPTVDGDLGDHLLDLSAQARGAPRRVSHALSDEIQLK